MKQLYKFLYLFCAILFLASCQEDVESLGGGTGYLRLTVGSSNEMTTKAAELPEGYDGTQIAVEIVNESGETVKQTDDWETWDGEQIALAAGKYTIKAHSYGFDGKQSAMGAPYYYGSKVVTIENGKEANETITCKLANVKVSVKIADDIKENFSTFGVTVKPQDDAACDPLTFDIDLSAATVKDIAYFPVTNLIVAYSATSKEGSKQNSEEYQLNEVAGNDHYILNFTLKAQASGNGNVTVTVDPTTHEYSYTFVVSTVPTDGATLTANAWAKFAYLSAANVTAASGTSLEGLKFQYGTSDDWKDVETTVSEGTYTATATGLNPATEYNYRLVTADGETVLSSSTFTTEAATELYNGDFDDWYQNGKTWYAMAQGDFSNNFRFWDSSNPGTTTGAGAIVNKNPTTGVESPVHTPDGKAASLKSEHISVLIVEKFAAASLYTGSFVGLSGLNGAKIDFGQSFEARPISLKGYFQYAPAKIDSKDVGNSGVLKEGDNDQCSIFIILSKGTYQVDNTKTETLLTADNVWAKEQFIAYGELPVADCVSTEGQWKGFEIPLKYKNLTEKPTHIIIVCSSSKYGDYFTGGNGSTMYLDDFSLVYEGTPQIWEGVE